MKLLIILDPFYKFLALRLNRMFPRPQGLGDKGDQWNSQVTQIQVTMSLIIAYGLVITRRLQPTRLGVVSQAMQSDLRSMTVTSLLAWPPVANSCYISSHHFALSASSLAREQ